MPKLTFDTYDECLSIKKFETKADWDEFIVQFRPYRGYYNPQPLDMSPTSFPCMMLSQPDRIIHRSNKNDEYPNFFLYGATLEEDEETEEEQD